MEMNEYGLTFEQWLSAANEGGQAPYLDSEIMRKAWKEGEDPCEWRYAAEMYHENIYVNPRFLELEAEYRNLFKQIENVLSQVQKEFPPPDSEKECWCGYGGSLRIGTMQFE